MCATVAISQLNRPLLWSETTLCVLPQREAAAAREELKGARKDLLRMRNEGNALRALYDIGNVKAAEQSALADQRIAALASQLADAADTMADMTPIAELQSARQEANSVRVGRVMLRASYF